MKITVRSLWWKLTVANVVVILLGSLLAVMALGPALDAHTFHEAVQPPRMASLLERERELLEGRLDDPVLAMGLLRTMERSLLDAQGSHEIYGIAYSSQPRVSLAVYTHTGRSVARIDAPGLELPATWLPGPQRLETISNAERLLVLPLRPNGMLVVRHFAEFSVWKNLQNTLTDAGSFLWFLILMVSIPGSALGIGLTHWLTQRLRRMAAASQAWSQGDFSVRINDHHADELGRHAAALNMMATQLECHIHTEQELATLKAHEHLARELHDGIKQQVFATGLQLHAALQWLARDTHQCAESLRRAQAINQTVSEDLIGMLSQLKPDHLAQEPLKVGLLRALQPWEGQIQSHVAATSNVFVPPGVAHELARIVAEGAANAVRHAAASRLDVQVTQEEGRLMVEIRDNGSGFDPNRIQEGMGLASMRQRASRLPDGQITLHTSAQGTQLIVSLRNETGATP